MTALVVLSFQRDDDRMHARVTPAFHAMHEQDPAEFLRMLAVFEDALHTYADQVGVVRDRLTRVEW